VQRFRCIRCGKTFSEPQPLEGLRIETEKTVQCVHMLVEGVGIRAIERLTGLSRETVLNILNVSGLQCADLLDSKVRKIMAEYVQADEIHCFVGAKQQNIEYGETERGDFFTYLAIDRKSKLIITFRTGKRTSENTTAFLLDLRARMLPGFQLTTDGFAQYTGSDNGVKAVFGDSIHYATEVKYYGTPQPFVPRQVIAIHRKRRIGNPNMAMATTCHMERTNLSVRLFTRRFTRCTLGYSKTVPNLCRAVALFVAHFNFCRVHSSLSGKTPAMAAGLTDHVWPIGELLQTE
jgi:IS1 family transposase